MLKKAIFGAVAAVALITGVHAGAITTPPPKLIATGDVKAVYIFANADDTSVLSEVSPLGIANIFCNHMAGSCAAASAGDIVDLGTQSGELVFTLNNTTTGKTYTSNLPDSDGIYHAVFSTDYSTFKLGSLPPAAATVLAGLSNVTFVAWEDHDTADKSDFDYNDLVFAFSNTTPSIPEPLSIALVGAGLLGLAGLRNRRTKN